MADRRQRLLDEIGQRRDDLVALTRALVRIPTLNPPGDCYREICDFLAKRLRPKGFAMELILTPMIRQLLENRS